MVSRSKELESRLEHTELQLRLIQNISRYLTREAAIPGVLNEIVTLVVEFMQSDSCLLYLIDHDELVLCATNAPQPANIGQVRLRIDEGLTGWVAREHRVLAISRDAYRDPRFKSFSDLPEDTFEAFLSAPITVRGRVLGVINVQHRLPHSHTGGEMELLTTIGELVGSLLMLSQIGSAAASSLNPVELVLPSGSVVSRP